MKPDTSGILATFRSKQADELTRLRAENETLTAERDRLRQQLEAAHSSDLRSLLVDIAQVFDGWHADGTAWSEWDESVRGRITKVLEDLR